MVIGKRKGKNNNLTIGQTIGNSPQTFHIYIDIGPEGKVFRKAACCETARLCYRPVRSRAVPLNSHLPVQNAKDDIKLMIKDKSV